MTFDSISQYEFDAGYTQTHWKKNLYAILSEISKKKIVKIFTYLFYLMLDLQIFTLN
jgi:hypothetical protein